MPSHTDSLLDVFPTPETSPTESPSGQLVQCSAESELIFRFTGNENGESVSPRVPLVADEMAQPTGMPENTHNEPMKTPTADGIQEGMQKVEEGVYRWTLPAIFPNGKPLGIKENEKHCLPVLLRIILEIYKVFFPKLSDDTTRFGQNLKELDPESAQEIFDDLEVEVEKYKRQNPDRPLIDSEDFWSPKCTPALAAKIVDYAYQMAIPSPEKLNTHYKSFSSATYGETNIAQIASILDELKVTEEDVFVDLGSGVGSLVTYAATRNLKKAIGIEQEKFPADLADIHAEMFDRLMDHFGKSKGFYDHCRGSFLSDEFHKLIKKEATIIFMNNFAFSDDLMRKITKLLENVQQGTRIVFTKTLATRRKETIRNKDSNFESICEPKEMVSIQGGVSWTPKAIPFFMGIVDFKKYEIDVYRRIKENEEKEILKIEEYVKRYQRLENAARRQQQLMDDNGGVLPETGRKRKQKSKKGGKGWSKRAKK